MLRAFEGEGFDMSQGNTGNEVIDGFLADFNTDNNFSRKMKCYAEFICSHPDLKSEIEEQPSGVITRSTAEGKRTDKISAKRGQFNHKEQVLTLIGNVTVNSSTGDKILTKEMVIKL